MSMDDRTRVMASIESAHSLCISGLCALGAGGLESLRESLDLLEQAMRPSVTDQFASVADKDDGCEFYNVVAESAHALVKSLVYVEWCRTFGSQVIPLQCKIKKRPPKRLPTRFPTAQPLTRNTATPVWKPEFTTLELQRLRAALDREFAKAQRAAQRERTKVEIETAPNSENQIAPLVEGSPEEFNERLGYCNYRVAGQICSVTPGEDDILIALIAAGGSLPNEQSLKRQTGYPDAARILRSLKKREPWCNFIETPGRRGRGKSYKLKGFRYPAPKMPLKGP